MEIERVNIRKNTIIPLLDFLYLLEHLLLDLQIAKLKSGRLSSEIFFKNLSKIFSKDILRYS